MSNSEDRAFAQQLFGRVPAPKEDDLPASKPGAGSAPFVPKQGKDTDSTRRRPDPGRDYARQLFGRDAFGNYG